MRVISRDYGKSHLRRELEDSAIQLCLIFRIVRLNFEVVVLEGVGVPGCGFFRSIPVVTKQVDRNLPGHAGGRDDNSFAVACEQLSVYTRSGVKALRVAEGGKLDAILVADFVF